MLAVVLVVAISGCPSSQPSPASVSASTVPPSSPARSPTRVYLEATAETMAQGDTIEVLIKIDDVANLAGAEVHLSFDPAVVEVIDADPASAGVQIAPGQLIAADFVAVNNADNASGVVDYGVVQIDRPEVTGSGILASIGLRGKAAGTSPIAFRSVAAAPDGLWLSDSAGRPIPTTADATTITVQ
jgi:hypothetical protein